MFWNTKCWLYTINVYWATIGENGRVTHETNRMEARYCYSPDVNEGLRLMDKYVQVFKSKYKGSNSKSCTIAYRILNIQKLPGSTSFCFLDQLGTIELSEQSI